MYYRERPISFTPMCSLYRCSFHLLDLISQKGEEGGWVRRDGMLGSADCFCVFLGVWCMWVWLVKVRRRDEGKVKVNGEAGSGTRNLGSWFCSLVFGIKVSKMGDGKSGERVTTKTFIFSLWPSDRIRRSRFHLPMEGLVLFVKQSARAA